MIDPIEQVVVEPICIRDHSGGESCHCGCGKIQDSGIGEVPLGVSWNQFKPSTIGCYRPFGVKIGPDIPCHLQSKRHKRTSLKDLLLLCEGDKRFEGSDSSIRLFPIMLLKCHILPPVATPRS